MDFTTISKKLKNYTSFEAFAYDVQLVISNTLRYFQPDSDLYQQAKALRILIEKKIISIIEQYNQINPNNPYSKYHSLLSYNKMDVFDKIKLGHMMMKLKAKELIKLTEIVYFECPEAIDVRPNPNDPYHPYDLYININLLDDDNLQKVCRYIMHKLKRSYAMNSAKNNTQQQQQQQVATTTTQSASVPSITSNNGPNNPPAANQLTQASPAMNQIENSNKKKKKIINFYSVLF